MVQQVFINHDNDLIDVTLQADAPTKTEKNVLPTTKQQDADVKSHGSLAPPSSTEVSLISDPMRYSKNNRR